MSIPNPPDLLLTEATYEQLHAELYSRHPNMLLVVEAADGTDGTHRRVSFGNDADKALALAEHAKWFICHTEHRLANG